MQTVRSKSVLGILGMSSLNNLHGKKESQWKCVVFCHIVVNLQALSIYPHTKTSLLNVNKVVTRAFLRVEHQLRHHGGLRGKSYFLGVGKHQGGGIYRGIVDHVVLCKSMKQ